MTSRKLTIIFLIYTIMLMLITRIHAAPGPFGNYFYYLLYINQIIKQYFILRHQESYDN